MLFFIYSLGESLDIIDLIPVMADKWLKSVNSNASTFSSLMYAIFIGFVTIMSCKIPNDLECNPARGAPVAAIFIALC